MLQEHGQGSLSKELWSLHYLSLHRCAMISSVLNGIFQIGCVSVIITP